jgi:hypothetical protein
MANGYLIRVMRERQSSGGRIRPAPDLLITLIDFYFLLSFNLRCEGYVSGSLQRRNGLQHVRLLHVSGLGCGLFQEREGLEKF